MAGSYGHIDHPLFFLVMKMGLKTYLTRKMIENWEEKDHKILVAQSLPVGIREKTDIPYIKDGCQGHLLDVYYPEDIKAKLPVIVDIHGGGFIYSNKEMNKDFGYYLAKRGYVVFNINYRLAFTETKIPGQIQDVAAAIRWVRDHLDLYPAQRGKVFLIGDSAGGLLATMAALIAKSKRLQNLFGANEIGDDINAVAVVSGMMNLEDDKLIYRLLRSICLEKGYRSQEYYQNLIFDNLTEINDSPPIFLATSEEDELRHMTFNFEKILKKYNVEHQIRCFKKGAGRKLGHVFSVLHPEYEESKELIDEIAEFFRDKSFCRHPYSAQ